MHGCEAYVDLLWQPHNHASLGALRAQIPTESARARRGASWRGEGGGGRSAGREGEGGDGEEEGEEEGGEERGRGGLGAHRVAVVQVTATPRPPSVGQRARKGTHQPRCS